MNEKFKLPTHLTTKFLKKEQLEKEKFAIDFHKWCKNNAIKHTLLGKVESYKELLEIYKKQQE